MRRCLTLLVSALLIAPTIQAVDHYEFTTPPTPVGVGNTATVQILAKNGGSTDLDYNGNVYLSSSSLPGSFAYTPSPVSFSLGVANVNLVLTTAGNIEITAADSVATTISSVAGIVPTYPDTVHHLIILRHSAEVQEIQTPGVAPGYSGSYPYGVTVTAGFPVAVSIVAVDQYFNTVTGVEFQYTVYSGLDVNPATANTTTGIAAFSWNPNPTIEGREDFFAITVADPYGSLAASPINRFNYIIIPNTFHMWVDAPDDIYAGVPFSVTITASTSQIVRNPASGANNYQFRLEPHLPTGPLGHGTLTPTNCTFDSSGKVIRDYTYTSAESFQIIPILVSPLNEKSINQAYSHLILGRAGMPAALSVAVSPAHVQAQHSAIISVTVRDAYQNLCPNVPVSFTKLAGSDDSVLSAAMDSTDSSGVAQVTFTGGIINETATVQVKLNELIQNVDIDVSVASPEGGEIVNYPNPFDPRVQKTLINYFLEAESDVEIRIYDAFGRIVLSRDVAKGEGAGDFAAATRSGGASFFWDGHNGENKLVGNGIYLIKVTARNSVAVQTFKRRVGVLK